MSDYSEDSIKSQFNAGIAQMERIDALQRATNAAKFNPLMKNIETGTYGYQIIMSSIHTLIDEAWGKLTKVERDMMTRAEHTLVNYEKFYPPIIINRNGEMTLNHKNYDKFMSLCTFMLRKLKELYDIHRLNSPSMDDDSEVM